MNGKSMDPEVTARIEQGLAIVPKVVASLATNFPRHVERAELVRAGALGLVEAAWRYDSTRGVPFERYAATRIRGAVLDAVRAEDWAPRSVRAAARRIALVESSLTARYGRTPTTEELASEAGTSPERVLKVKALVAQSAVASLDGQRSTPLTSEQGTDQIADLGQPDVVELLEQAELLRYLHEAVDALPRRQQIVIFGQFLEGRTTVDLAQELGVSRSRVSQMRADALDELRRSITGHYGPVPKRDGERSQPQVRRAASSA